MTEKQRTIKKSVSYSGTGLHTGCKSTITFHPAPENYGYKFIRTDIEEPFELPALVDYVVDLSRGTTLGKDGVKVHTVEHVLAALVGLQIDNCKIELSAKEPPIGDGSSMPYVEALLEADVEEQEAAREYFILDETIRFQNEEKFVEIVALPTDDFRVTVLVDYFNPALGSQHTGLFDLEKEFVSEFAPARTFCFLNEVEMLHDMGLIKGANLESAIVIVDRDMNEDELHNLKDKLQLDFDPKIGKSGILNDMKLRYKNEPARHKLLDMLGDMALAGVRLKAQVLAARPGHESNIEFAKLIRKAYLKNKPLQRVKSGMDKEPVINIDQLLQIMPHKYPIMLVDKIQAIDHIENVIVGVKNVTFNEPHFMGHFPDKPIMPGVLICEAMAQTGCLLLLDGIEDVKKVLIYFMGIKNAKFRKPVIPGDQLIMEVRMTGKRFNTFTFAAKAFVDGEVVTEAEFQAAMVDRKNV
jgi:UDP-3-O-[3-hydroxymyristoyl] N-acetylglucosamine deacetylase / 3-hydroxyacyl-[acyl-carrier-protein] dehydratase